jgi:hypothetical protein
MAQTQASLSLASQQPHSRIGLHLLLHTAPWLLLLPQTLAC